MSGPAIVDLPPQTGAGIEVAATRSTMGSTIRKTFDRLYAPGVLLAGHGRNFILYSNWTKDGVTLLVGVLDRQSGGADPDVKPAQVPGGRAITAPHFGDYEQMSSTYDALNAAVKTKGLRQLSRSLEVYGDWKDDPAKVRTDIYLYLAVAI
jgi:effector-binding domain-containing protein